MKQRKTPAPPAPARKVPVAREVTHGSWLESSFELLNGTDVHEGPDAVPDDLFDELFPPDVSKARPKP